MTEQESSDPAGGDKLSPEARAIDTQIKIKRELLTQKLTKMGNEARRRQSERRARALRSGIAYTGSIRDLVEQQAREDERDIQIVALEGESEIQELMIQRERAMSRANGASTVSDATKKVFSKNDGRRAKVKGPPIKDFWPQVLGSAAAWLAWEDAPLAQSKLEKFIADRIIELGRDPNTTQIRAYAREMLEGYQREEARRRR